METDQARLESLYGDYDKVLGGLVCGAINSLHVNCAIYSAAGLNSTRVIFACASVSCSNVNTPFVGSGRTPIEQAAAHGNLDAVRALIACGADVNVNHTAALTEAVNSKRSIDVMRALLAAGADPNARSPAGRTALMHAVYVKNEPAIRLLIDAGASEGDDTILSEHAFRALQLF